MARTDELADQLWTYTAPDVTETINLNEMQDGLSEGEYIDSYVANNWGDNVRLEINPGTYKTDGTFHDRSIADASIVGLGEFGDVEIQIDGWDSRADIHATGGTVLLENLLLTGKVTSGGTKLAADTGALLVLKHWRQPDGITHSSGYGVWTPSEASSSPHMNGEGRLLGCEFGKFTDNNCYIDGYHQRGTIHVSGGYYHNGVISSLRIGLDNQIVHRATMQYDSGFDETLSYAEHSTSRALRVRQKGDGMEINDCDVINDRSSVSKMVCWQGDAEYSTGEMTNCRVYNKDSSTYALSDDVSGSGTDDWSFDDIHLTGAGDNYRLSDNATIGTIYRGGNADSVDRSIWWGPSDDGGTEPGPTPTEEDDKQWRRRYDNYVDNFEVGELLYPYQIPTSGGSALGSASDWARDGTETAPDGASAGSLRADGSSTSLALYAGENDSLYWLPNRGDSFEHWAWLDDTVNNVVHRFFFFLEDANPGGEVAVEDLSGYIVRIGEGRLQLREYVDGSVGTALFDVAASHGTQVWNRAVVDTTDSDITVTLYDNQGSQVASGSATDSRFSGSGIMYWAPSGLESDESLHWDQVTHLDVDPDDRIDNFAHKDIDTFYERDGTLGGSDTWATIDSLEDADLSEYDGALSGYATTTAQAADGSVSLTNPAPTNLEGIGSHAGDGLDNYVDQGDTFRFRFYSIHPAGSGGEGAVFDDYESYTDASDMRSNYDGDAASYYLETTSPLEGTQSLRAENSYARIAWTGSGGSVSRGQTYECKLRSDQGTAHPGPLLEVQDPANPLDDCYVIHLSWRDDTVEIRGYQAGALEENPSFALDTALSTGTDYRLVVDYYLNDSGNVEFDVTVEQESDGTIVGSGVLTLTSVDHTDGTFGWHSGRDTSSSSPTYMDYFVEQGISRPGVAYGLGDTTYDCSQGDGYHINPNIDTGTVRHYTRSDGSANHTGVLDISTYPGNEWWTIEVTWGTDDIHEFTVYDAAGSVVDTGQREDSVHAGNNGTWGYVHYSDDEVDYVDHAEVLKSSGGTGWEIDDNAFDESIYSVFWDAITDNADWEVIRSFPSGGSHSQTLDAYPGSADPIEFKFYVGAPNNVKAEFQWRVTSSWDTYLALQFDQSAGEIRLLEEIAGSRTELDSVSVGYVEGEWHRVSITQSGDPVDVTIKEAGSEYTLSGTESNVSWGDGIAWHGLSGDGGKISFDTAHLPGGGFTGLTAASNLSLDATSTDEGTLSWTIQSDNWDVQIVYARWEWEDSWTEIARHEDNTSSQTVELLPGRSRSFYVETRLSGDSEDSNIVSGTAQSLGLSQDRTPDRDWSVLAESSNPGIDRPAILSGSDWGPTTNGLPSVRLAVPQDDRWDAQKYADKDWKLYKGGTRLPVDTLVEVEHEPGRTILTIEGGTQLRQYTDDIQYQRKPSDVAVDEILQARTSYGRDIDAPPEEIDEGVHLIDASSEPEMRDWLQIEFDEDVTPPEPVDETIPISCYSAPDHGLVLDQTCFVETGFDISSNAQQASYPDGDAEGDNYHDGEKWVLSSVGDYVEFNFNLDHTVNGNDLRAGIAVALPETEGTESPGFQWTFDGTDRPAVGAGVFGQTADKTTLRTISDVGVNGETYGSITTVRITLTETTTDSCDAHVCLMWGEDQNHEHSSGQASDVVDRGSDYPALYPERYQVETHDQASIFTVVAGRLVTTQEDPTPMSDALDFQLAISNDSGSTWHTSTGTDEVTADFGSDGESIRGRLQLSRWGNEDTTVETTPRKGFNPTVVWGFNVYGDLDLRPEIFDKSYREPLVDVLNDIASSGPFVWEVRWDRSEEEYEVVWTQPGQRQRTGSESIVDYAVLTDKGDQYDRVVVFGTSNSIEDEEFGVNSYSTDKNDPENKRGLDESWIIPDSETVHDQGNEDVVYERGTDYVIDWAQGMIALLEGGDMATGTFYEIDYDWRTQGEYPPARGLSQDEIDNTLERRFPEAASDVACEQVASSIYRRVREPRVEARVVASTENPRRSLVEAFDRADLPFDEPVTITNEETRDGEVVWDVETRQSVTDIMEEVRTRLRTFATRLR